MPRKTAVKKAAPARPSPADLAAEINKVFGANAVTLGSHEALAVRRWPTGVLPIDHILDGGIPRGRFIELYGPYSTMKSYVLYRALGSCQRQGGKCALVDTEHAFDPEWAEQLGVDVADLLVSHPEDAEQGIGVLEALIRQGYDMLGFDSIAAAIPRQHRTSMPGEDSQPAALARVMSKGLARLNSANKHTSVICVNQTREKIGVTFGSPVTTSGGRAMGFYASYRLSFVRTGKITEPVRKWDGAKWVDAKRVTGHTIQATLEKSKLSAPHSDTLFTYDLRTGEVDDVGYLIAQALERGLFTRDGTGRWAVPGILDGTIHGKDAFREFVDGEPELIDWVREQVLGG